MDLVIRSNRIWTSDGWLDGGIMVRGGIIQGVFLGDNTTTAENMVDARGLVVLPGVIDTHTHIRYPGHPEREDFQSGSAAAAAGGITTLLEMPISTPGVRTAEIVRNRMESAEAYSLVDVAFYAGGGHGARQQFQAMADAGVIGYKVFLHRPQAGREDEFDGLYTIDDGELLDDLKELASIGRRVVFHAECDPILEFERKRLEHESQVEYMAHSWSHPVIAEVEAVSRVIRFAQHTGASVGIVHVTSPFSAKLIQDAKSNGVNIVAETCPHYLFFSEEDLKEHGPFAKINPPLRSPEERAGLWEYVRNGTIDYIGTDHAPFTLEEKLRGEQNIFAAPSGIPGFDTELPLLLTAVNDGKLTWSELVNLTSRRQAEIFSISDRKGSITIGKDADFAIVDPEEKWVLDHSRMHTKARDIARIYDGIQVQGKVVQTFVRGTCVFDRGKVVGTPGHGQRVVPHL